RLWTRLFCHCGSLRCRRHRGGRSDGNPRRLLQATQARSFGPGSGMTRFIALLLTAFSAFASAHDLVLDVEFARPEVSVGAAYGPGEPAAGAIVFVAAAGEPDIAAATGETDAE